MILNICEIILKIVLVLVIGLIAICMITGATDSRAKDERIKLLEEENNFLRGIKPKKKTERKQNEREN